MSQNFSSSFILFIITIILLLINLSISNKIDNWEINIAKSKCENKQGLANLEKYTAVTGTRIKIVCNDGTYTTYDTPRDVESSNNK